MTVKELKEALKLYDDNADVLLTAPDDAPCSAYHIRVVPQDSDREYFCYLESE
jgi:hypothetical protein